MKFLKSIFSLAVLTLLTFNAFGQLANIDRGCVPLRIEFTAPAGASGFFWDLGDGNIITDQNPFRTYTTPDTYIIEFREVSGGPVTARDTVILYDQPVIDFVADTTTGCTPLDVEFTSNITADPAVPIDSYNWSFGDGDSGTGAMVSHTYSTAGTRKVGLTMTSSFEGCTAFAEKDDYISINDSPATMFSPSATSACDPPLDVLFNNTTPNPDNNLTYEWDFGNGQTSTEANPSTITYTQNGSFTVSLTATDSVGCSSSFFVLIGVGGPAVDFEVQDTVCVNNPVLFTNNSSIGQYNWTVDSAGVTVRTTFQRTPSFVFRGEGNYDVTLTVSDPAGNCTSTLTKTIYVEEIQADLEIDPTTLCELPGSKTYTALGSGINASWAIYDERIDSNYISTDNPFKVDFERDTQTYGYNGLRILEVTLEVTNARGCVDRLEVLDTIRPPNALFRPDTTFGCAPLAVTFESSHSTSFEAITTYTYSWGDGTPDQTSNNDDPVTHTFMQAGEYDVVLIIENASGCVDTSYAVTIEVGAPVNVDFTADQTSICQGDSIQFMGSSIDSMLIDAWHFDTDGSRLSHCADDQNPNWIFGSMSGMMDVTATVLYNGCPSSLTRNDFIEVKGPIAKIDYEVDCSDPFEYIFADSSMQTAAVTWDFGDGNTSVLQHPSHVYDETGDYVVTMTAVNGATGCPASIDTISVHVREIKAEMEPLEDTYCIGEPFMFNAADAQDVNGTCWQGYTWFPSDSRPIETQDASIDYAWTGRGEQTVELIVVDINGCQDTIRDTTIVFEVRGEFEFDPIRLCAPGTVNFTDLSDADAQIEDWKWIFGDNPADTITDQNPSHTFNTTPMPVVLPDGTVDTFYTAVLIVFDSLRCSDTVEYAVDFYEPITNPTVTDRQLCIGDEITFNTSDFTQEGNNLTYEWFLNGTSISTDKTGTIVFDGNAPTVVGDNTLEVRATETNTGCPAVSFPLTIELQEFPDATFTSPIDDNGINCAGQIVPFTSALNPDLIVNYIWDMGDGTVIPRFDNPSIFDYSFGVGNFTVMLEAESSFGCKSTSTRDYIFVGPTGELMIDPNEGCVGDEITYEVSGLSSVNFFAVEFGDGNSDENQLTGSHIYTSSGFPFEVVLNMRFDTLGLECRDAVSDTVRIGSIPDLDFFGDFEHCANDTDTVAISLTGSIPPGAFINWSPAAFVQNPNSDVAVIDLNNIDESFTLSVIVTADGCPGIKDSLFQFTPTPNIEGDSISILVQEGQTNFPLPPINDALNDLNINWSPGTDLNQTDIVNPIVAQIGENSRTYVAFVTDDSGCYNEEFVRLVNIFQVPNIFSPNGDQLNANFNILTVGDSEIRSEDIVSFQVFNRWGQRVYNNESPTTGWDGTFNGNDQPTDVYVYKIQVRLADGTTSDVIAGDVTLIR